jgi:lipopolysaccharide/colanic/teichoic acid biosynthesis glycosyltransferase
VFAILKLRTMLPVPIAPESESWTELGDCRITSLGRVLRITHLDELPQLLNVLRGELSLIGPRPEQPQFVAELKAKLPYYDVRHLVRPGLTGWAQVKYPYGSNVEDALQKLQYEVYYLRRQSLKLDALIAWRTLRAVALRRGR